MGINYNPRGVSEGLIYYIDPYNNRSYSGTGNTVYNLVNASIGGTFVGSTAAPIDSTSTRTFYMGGSNYINCPNNIPLTNNFTVSVWFKLNAYNNSSIINKWFADSSPTNHRSWFLGSETSSSSVVVVLSSDGTYTNPTIKRYAVPVNLNEYTNITFTFATGTLTVYKNGLLATVTKSLDASFTTVYDNPTRSIQIGYGYDAGNYYGLANVGITQIYNRVLSPTEILQNYDAIEKRYYPEENIVRDGLILNLDPGNSRSYAGAGNTIYDLSGFGNTGTLVSTTFSSLNNGSLSGVISKNSSVNSGQNFTVSAWIYPTSFATRNAIVGNAYPYSSNAGWYFFTANNYFSLNQSLFFSAGADQVSVGSISYVLPLNSWSYVSASVSNGGSSVKLYVNGIETSYGRTSYASLNLDYSTNEFYIGKRHSAAGDNFGGNISQVKIYNRALSQQEIQQNYNATKNRFINVLPPVRDNLILNLDAGNLASYPGSGTTWFDLSGSNNTSVLTNGPAYVFNDSSSNISFDGSNDYVVVNSNANLLSKTEYTKFVFFYATSFSTANNLISGGVSGTNHAFWLNFSNRLYAGHNASWLTVTGSTTLSTNTWYCGAVTYSNVSGWKLYLNGVLDGTSVTSTTFDNNGELLIAAYANANVFTGRMPLALVYNRALSAAEIAQNFNFYRSRYGI